MKDVILPDAFKKLCLRLGQDIDLELATPGITIFDIALGGSTSQEAAVIVAFIDQLLGMNYSPDQMKSFWWATPATVVFYDGVDVVKFLTELRDVASKPPYTPASGQ